MEIPKVILIGGAPSSGKTALARILASKFQYSCISTDDAVQAVRAVTTSESHPGFHVMAGHDYREYYIDSSAEKLVADAQRQHEATWPAIEQIIRIHSMWASPAVIEGWGLQPEYVAQLTFPATKSLWLVADDRALEQRVRKAKGFLKGASDQEKLVHQFLGRSVWFNQHIKQAAGRLRLPILEAPMHATPEELAQTALAILAADTE